MRTRKESQGRRQALSMSQSPASRAVLPYLGHTDPLLQEPGPLRGSEWPHSHLPWPLSHRGGPQDRADYCPCHLVELCDGSSDRWAEMRMSWPVSVTPQASQTLRGDQIEKQLLQGRAHGLKWTVGQTGFQSRGAEALKWPGTSRAQSSRMTAKEGEEGREGQSRRGKSNSRSIGSKERLVRGQSVGSKVKVSPHLAGSAVRPSGQRGTPGHPWGQQGNRQEGPGA